VLYCEAIPGVSGTVAQVGKTASDCDRCSMMGEAVRAIGFLWE